MVNFPFEQTPLKSNQFIRTFSSTVDSSELKWHWDEKLRKVQIIENEGWFFQFDNELPFVMEDELIIEAGRWHRILKGEGILKVIITEGDI